jgi:hypothetical protein
VDLVPEVTTTLPFPLPGDNDADVCRQPEAAKVKTKTATIHPFLYMACPLTEFAPKPEMAWFSPLPRQPAG